MEEDNSQDLCSAPLLGGGGAVGGWPVPAGRRRDRADPAGTSMRGRDHGVGVVPLRRSHLSPIAETSRSPLPCPGSGPPNAIGVDARSSARRDRPGVVVIGRQPHVRLADAEGVAPAGGTSHDHGTDRLAPSPGSAQPDACWRTSLEEVRAGEVTGGRRWQPALRLVRRSRAAGPRFLGVGRTRSPPPLVG